MRKSHLALLATLFLLEAPAFEKIALVDNMDFSFVFDIEKPGGNRQVFDYVQTLGPTLQLWRGQAGGLLRYPSRAEYDGHPSVEVPVDKRRIPANFLTTGWLKVDEREHDGMREAVDCCRAGKVGFGIHWSTEESHGATWCLGPWNLAHPECWCRRNGGAPWPGRASLAFPEVVEHKMAIARELNAYAPQMVYVDFYRAYGAEPMWEYVRPVIDAWRARYDEEPPKDWQDPRWVKLVTEFNHRFVRELHKAMPKSQLVLAVDRMGERDDYLRVNRAVSWRELVAEGAVDAIGVMCVLPDWNDPWNSTRRIYEDVMRVCRGKAKVYFPVNAYSGSIRPGLYEYAKRLGISPEEATRRLLELAAEVGADGVTLECVDYGNYTPGVAKVIREFSPGRRPAEADKREIVMNVDFCDIIRSKYSALKKRGAAPAGYTEADIRAMLHRCKLNGCDSVNWRVASLGVCCHPSKYFADAAFISKWAKEKRFVEVDRRKPKDWEPLNEEFLGAYTLTQAACPDTLAVAADACRKEGLKLYFWVDLHDEMFGRFVSEHPECLVRTKDGARYPGVRDYGNEEAVKERLLELEELYRYQPDGFYFCTSAHTRHFRFDEPDGAFGTLKADTFTAFLRRVRASMRPHGFKLIMGAGCAGRLDFCTPYFSENVKYAIQHDWHTWVDEDLVDGLVCGDYERLLVMCGGWRAKGVYRIAPERTAADVFLPEFTRYCKGKVKLYGFSDWITYETFGKRLSAASDMVVGYGLDGLHIHEEMLIDGFKGGWEAVRTMRNRFDREGVGK